MRVMTKGNRSITGKYYSRTVFGYCTIWDVKIVDGNIVKEEIIKENANQNKISKKTLQNTKWIVENCVTY